MLRYNYHDASLISFSLGPRYELKLQLLLDPIWNPGVAQQVSLRLGAIGNYGEVEAFFRAMPAASSLDIPLDQVDQMRYEAGQLHIHFDRNGSLLISSNKLLENSK